MYSKKSKDIKIVKRTFIGIYILNVTDVIFTLLLLNTGLFMEGNIFMRQIIHNAPLSLAVKIFIPLFLMLYVFHRLNHTETTFKVLRMTKIGLFTTLSVYGIINVLHLFYIYTSFDTLVGIF